MSPEDATIIQLESQVSQLKRLVELQHKVILDFMPNIKTCVLQDYGALNEALTTHTLYTVDGVLS